MMEDALVAPAFIKKSIIGALLIMFLLSSMISLFVPTVDKDLDAQLNAVNDEYYQMTGRQPTSEEVWAVTGIYTPVGIGADGTATSAWGTTRDGWVYGARIINYSPSQYNDSQFAGGQQGYRVSYSEETGLYYYTYCGTDLISITVDEDDLEESTLLTSVSMDRTQKSNRFFTTGSKVERDNGTFYYDFSGYRYVFQPLRSYTASNDLNVDKTTSSLSLIWYQYFNDEGISGQLILSGSDAGISYLRADDIIRSFNTVNFTSKFDMIFNGISMHIYIQINPYAAQHYDIGYCFNQGYWSILVTSPAITDSTSGFTLNTFSIDRILETIWNLFTFNTDQYGLTGIAKTMALMFFNVSLYATLLSIALISMKTMAVVGILGGILAAVQAFNFFG